MLKNIKIKIIMKQLIFNFIKTAFKKLPAKFFNSTDVSLLHDDL